MILSRIPKHLECGPQHAKQFKLEFRGDKESRKMKQFLLFLCLAAVPALAHPPGYFGSEPWRPTGFFGVGFSTPVIPLPNRLNTGWNVAGGIGVTRNYFGVTVDAMLNDFGISRGTLAQVGPAAGVKNSGP